MHISWTTNDCARACVVVLDFLPSFFFCVCFVRCFPIDIFISLVFPRAVGLFALVFLSPVLLDSDERCNSSSSTLQFLECFATSGVHVNLM